MTKPTPRRRRKAPPGAEPRAQRIISRVRADLFLNFHSIVDREGKAPSAVLEDLIQAYVEANR